MSNTKTEATRLADELRSHVQTYPQMSEDEPGGYCSQDDQLMDEAATELLSLDAQNKAMHKIIDQLRAQLSKAVAEEREACAKVCDDRYMGDNNREDMEAKRCAAAIRARSNT